MYCKKYKIFILLAAVLIIMNMAGCKKFTHNGVFAAQSVDIKYINTKGEDLLNPNHLHAITEQNTNLYYLINGKKEKVYKANLDAPKMFKIGNDFDSTGSYWMIVSPNTPYGQNTATTYIDFKDYPTDTLKVHYQTYGASISVRKIWYNGELKWDIVQRRQPKITITKHLSVK